MTLSEFNAEQWGLTEPNLGEKHQNFQEHSALLNVLDLWKRFRQDIISVYSHTKYHSPEEINRILSKYREIDEYCTGLLGERGQLMADGSTMAAFLYQEVLKIDKNDAESMKNDETRETTLRIL